MPGVTFSYGTGTIVTAEQWTALFAQCLPANTVSPYSVTLLTGTTQGSWFTALGLPSAAPGTANGLATLNATGVVPSAQIPASLLGAMYPQGDWNASTNNPALASGTGTKGFFYRVATAGTTTLDGNSSWSVGDCVFFDGVAWRKINGSGNAMVPSTNITDSTAAGRALLTSASVSAQRMLLNIDQAQLVADTDQTITNVMEAVAWTSLSAPRVGSLPAVSSLSAGQGIYVWDESGNCSLTNTITLNANGADTISGAASYVLNKPFAGVVLFRASVSKFTALPFGPFVPAWITQPVSVRQTVISGPVDANGLPTFLPSSSASLSITSLNITSSAPFVVTGAGGASNIGQLDTTGASTSNLTWGSLTASTTNYLGVIVNSNGTLTTFSTTIQPVYQQGGTPSVTSGAVTFNIGTMTCFQGNGSSAPQVYRVFVAQVVTSASTVTSVTQYAYNGVYDGAYIATLPASGITTINHNIGIIPNTCEIYFKNLTAEFNYNVGDIILARSGMVASASYEVFLFSVSSTLANFTSGANYNALNKTTAAGVNLTLANWSYRVRATRGW